MMCSLTTELSQKSSCVDQMMPSRATTRQLTYAPIIMCTIKIEQIYSWRRVMQIELSLISTMQSKQNRINISIFSSKENGSTIPKDYEKLSYLSEGHFNCNQIKKYTLTIIWLLKKNWLMFENEHYFIYSIYLSEYIFYIS